MAMDYCRQCNKPFDRIGSTVLCFRCHESERKEYQRIYKLLSPMLHRMDFFLVSEKVNVDAGKLRDVLLFRLGSGQVQELADLKKGSCHLCLKKLANKDNIEPLCISCLKQIEEAVEPLVAKPKEPISLVGRKPTSKVSDIEQVLQQALTPPTINCPCCGNDAKDSVCKTCYTQVLAQLKWYRLHYGDIPEEERVDIAQATTGEVDLTPDAHDEHAPAASEHTLQESNPEESGGDDAVKVSEEEQGIKEVMKILAMDEEDPELMAGDMDDLMDFSKVSDNSKKFGFKRIKLK